MAMIKAGFTLSVLIENVLCAAPPKLSIQKEVVTTLRLLLTMDDMGSKAVIVNYMEHLFTVHFTDTCDMELFSRRR